MKRNYIHVDDKGKKHQLSETVEPLPHEEELEEVNCFVGGMSDNYPLMCELWHKQVEEPEKSQLFLCAPKATWRLPIAYTPSPAAALTHMTNTTKKNLLANAGGWYQMKDTDYVFVAIDKLAKRFSTAAANKQVPDNLEMEVAQLVNILSGHPATRFFRKIVGYNALPVLGAISFLGDPRWYMLPKRFEDDRLFNAMTGLYVPVARKYGTDDQKTMGIFASRCATFNASWCRLFGTKEDRLKHMDTVSSDPEWYFPRHMMRAYGYFKRRGHDHLCAFNSAVHHTSVRVAAWLRRAWLARVCDPAPIPYNPEKLFPDDPVAAEYYSK